MTLDSIERALLSAGIDEARTEAYILCEHYLSIPRARLMLMRGEELDCPELSLALERRVKREPLAYILGRAYFMNEVYRVTPDCLIPRPETELLVLEAESATQKWLEKGEVPVLDLCTGSGCVAVSLLCRCPFVTADALDVSSAALALAEYNAAANGVGERFRPLCADLFSYAPRERYAVITANPPYVTAEEMGTLEKELSFEPAIALTDGGDGLSFVRELCARYADCLLPGGTLLCEIGSGEGEASLEIARGAGRRCEILPDLSGRDRILKITV